MSALANMDVPRGLLYLAGALLFLSFGYTEMAGSDMWWHIAAGRELLQTGTPWMVDDWSFSTHGGDWLNHEWLSDIIYFGWVSLFGVESLVYWKWLVIVTTFSLLQYALARQSGSPLAGLICAAMAIAVAAPFLDVRPHLYSLLNFGLLLVLLLGREASRPVLAGLFLVWVNLHGGFFYGLMALGILVFPWRNFSLDTFRIAFVTGLICLAASAVNPSGVKTFLYPLTYAFDTSSPYRQLGEWLDPFQKGGIRSPLFFTFMWFPAFALLYTLPRIRAQLNVPWEGLALTALTLAMALTSRRFIPLFGMSLAVMLAPLLGLLFARLKMQQHTLVAAVLALLFAAYRMLPYPLASGPAFHYLTAEYSYPVEMINFMEANGLQGNVYALYNWGGYLHWRTDGDLKVFIDGRADTVYDADAYRHYVSVLVGRPGWLESIEATEADYILWPFGRGSGRKKMQQLVATGRWTALFQDSVSWLAVRKSVRLPQRPGMAPPGPWQDVAMAQAYAHGGNVEEAMRYANKTRAAIPWHKTACAVLIDSHRRRGDEAAAAAVLAECRGHFPTAMLR